MKTIKTILFIIKNYTLGYMIKTLSWMHCRYSDYLAEINNHWYHVFRIGWRFKILNVKEIDSRKIEGLRWAQKSMGIKNATMHHTIDYSKHCIYIARPKQIINN